MFMLSFYRFLNNESTLICNTYEGLMKKKDKIPIQNPSKIQYVQIGKKRKSQIE